MLLVLAALWGTAFNFTKLALVSVPPTTLAAGRIALGALVLGALSRILGHRLPAGHGLWGRFALLALTGNALPFALIAWGQQRVDSGLAGILMAFMPLCTLVLAHFFVPGDRMTAPKTLGFACGFAGIVVLMGPEALEALGNAGSELPRQLAVLGGAVSYGVYAIVARRMPPLHPTLLAGHSLTLAAVVMLPLAMLLDAPWSRDYETGSLLAALWLGLSATALASLVYFRLIASAGVTFAALINFLIPPVALVTGVLALAEPVQPHALGALCLISLGLLLGRTGATTQA